MAEFYILRDGEQHGPYSGEQLHQLLQSGQVSPDELAWREGMSEWSELHEILGHSGPAVSQDNSKVEPDNNSVTSPPESNQSDAVKVKARGRRRTPDDLSIEEERRSEKVRKYARRSLFCGIASAVVCCFPVVFSWIAMSSAGRAKSLMTYKVGGEYRSMAQAGSILGLITLVIWGASLVLYPFRDKITGPPNDPPTLGDTLSVFEDRHPAALLPYLVDDAPSAFGTGDYFVSQWRDYNMLIVFANGECVDLTFLRSDESPLNKAEVEALLNLHSGGNFWVQGKARETFTPYESTTDVTPWRAVWRKEGYGGSLDHSLNIANNYVIPRFKEKLEDEP